MPQYDQKTFGNRDTAPENQAQHRQRGSTPRLIAIAVAVVIATAGMLVPVTAATAAPSVDRIAGPDRYATAVAISKSAFKSAPVVYVATGESFPDALSAAPAATKQGGPLLLTQSKSLPAKVRAEIVRLKPKTIVVVGGTGVVSAAVQTKLQKLAKTKRIGGTDRYDTSRKITSYAFTSSTTAYIATGRDFPDALSAAGAAGAANAPVVLVDGKKGTAGSATTSLLKRLKVKKTIIAGGTGVVSSGVQKSLKLFGVSRQGGSDRYQTSEKLNKSAAENSSHAYLATGTAFPDALAGAAVAGAKSKPLYVVPKDCVPSGTKSDLSGSTVTLLGGAGALGSGVAQLKACAPTVGKPTPPTTDPTPSPSADGFVVLGRSFPNSETTGVPAGTTLTKYTGPCTIQTPGAVIDSKHVNCYLRILAKGVVIKNSVINGGVYADYNDNVGSFTITDSEVSAGNSAGTGIGDAHFTATRVEVTGGTRSINCYANCTVQDSYVHGQFNDTSGVHHESGVRINTNSTLRHNTIACDANDYPPDAGCSAAITGYPDFDPVQNNTVDDNLIIAGSGGYCSYGGATAGKPFSGHTKNIKFTNNVYQRGTEMGAGNRGYVCGYWGPVTSFDTNAPGAVWSNNRWDDGTLVPSAN